MYKLYYYALQKNDPVFFRSMLQLIETKLSQNWVLNEQARFILVDVEMPEGLQYWQNPPHDKILIAYARQNTLNAEWFLPKPIRTQPLIQLLNEMAVKVAAPVVQNLAKIAPIPATGRIFQPEFYLAGLLQNTLKDQEIVKFTCSGFPPLYVVPKERYCLTQALQLNQINTAQRMFFAASVNEIECETLLATQLQKEIKQYQLVTYPIDTILWLSTLYASQGRFLSVDDQHCFIRLVQWPNFSIFPFQPYHMNLAAFMLKNTVNIQTIAQRTQCRLEDVIDFSNACSMIGILKREQVHHLVEKKMPEARRGLFKSILQRLTDSITFQK